MSAREATIHRVPHEQDYTVIANKAIEDGRLSLKALGLLVYLLSKPDHWQARVSELARSHNDGEYAIKHAMGELEKAGYLTKKRVGESVHARLEWEIHERSKVRENREPNEAEDHTDRENRGPQTAKTADHEYAKTARVVSTEEVSTESSTDLPSSSDDENLPAALFAVPPDNNATKAPKTRRARGSKPKSSPDAHRLTVLAFEQTPKPVTRGGFPGVLASFDRILQAGYEPARIERAIRAGIDGWTDQAILFAITKANGSKSAAKREAHMGVGPMQVRKVDL